MAEQIGPTELNGKTRGAIMAIDQLTADYAEQVGALRERAAANDGGRQAAAVIAKRIEGIGQLIINSAKEGKTNRDMAEIKLVIEGVQRAGKIADDVGQDYLQEALMLKGEARVLQSQVKKLVEKKDVMKAQHARKMADRAEDDEAAARRAKPRKKSSRKKKADGANGANT